MNNLSASLHQDVVTHSRQLAQEAKDLFDGFRSGRVYIPRAALRAMGRRYLHLRGKDDLNMLELFEFGRLYGFFALLYPPDGDIPSPADIAIEFCNLLSMGLPVSASVHGGGGE
jgi:hypothetical protein